MELTKAVSGRNCLQMADSSYSYGIRKELTLPVVTPGVIEAAATGYWHIKKPPCLMRAVLVVLPKTLSTRKVGEGTVGFSHLVRVFLLLYCGALAVVGVHQL